MARGRHGGRHGGGKNAGATFETSMDTLHNMAVPPTLINGMYTFIGNEMSFVVQAESITTPYQNTMMGQEGQSGSIQQANLTIVGNKTKTPNNCCYILTILLGSLLIFPLCFICCMWWKKIVYPTYELSLQAYQSIAYLIQSSPNMNNVALSVVDNAFNAEKARILYEALSRSRVTGFSFLNRALACNDQFNEADDFRNNMQPIKSLSLTSSIVWGDMIV
jgi:hypothetical protein